MRKFHSIILTIVIICLCICPAFAEKFKMKEHPIDLFSVKIKAPQDWKIKVGADHAVFQAPDDKVLQLVLLDVGKTHQSLDEFFSDYKDPKKNKSLKEAGLKIISTKNLDVSGHGAYYVRLKSNKKDFGHVILKRNDHLYIVALKTPRGQYDKYEDVVMEAAKSMKFYRPRVSK